MYIITYLTSFICSFIVWDIYLKKYFQSKLKKRIDPYLKNIFDIIDKEIFEKIKTGTGQEIRDWIREIVREIMDIQDETELEQNVNIILKRYDPTINADKINIKTINNKVI